jgi:hypothetical protein
MFDAYEKTPEFATITLIAETIRAELGVAVEACPSSTSPEAAEPLNRVFRARARRFLGPIAPPAHDLSALTTWALRTVVPRRLAAGGLDQNKIKVLLEMEPGTPDDWLTFLLLVPRVEVLYWLTAAGQEPD